MKKHLKKEKPIKKVMQVNLVTAFIIALTTYFITLPAYPDNLEDILQALDSKDLGKKPTPSEPNQDKWLEEDTNLARLLSNDSKNIGLLKDWVGDLTDKQFKFSHDEKTKKNEYISLVAYYISAAGDTITLTILVPHPKFIDHISSGLLEEFHKQEPPGLSVLATEKMVLKNNSAIYFQHKDKGCSLLFKLPKNSTLNINDKTCADARGIFLLAELLNIDRLKEKLES